MSAKVSRLVSIDGLRALAMTAVIAQHCGLLPFGWAGVWLFYVISGFVITSAIEQRRDEAQPFRQRYLHFMRRRAARIVPALAFYVVLCAVAALLFGKFNSFWPHLPTLATFSFNWWMIYTPEAAGPVWAPLGHLWTISVEQQFYLFFPLIAMLAPQPWRVRLCVLFIFAAPALRAATSALLAQVIPGRDYAFDIYAASHCQVDGFLLGALVAYQRESAIKKLGAWKFLGPIALLVLFTHCAAYYYINTLNGASGVQALRNIVSGILYGQSREVFVYLAVSLCASWLLVKALSGGRIAKLFSSNWISSIGQASYSGYLLHLLILWLASNIIPRTLSSDRISSYNIVLFIGVLGLTILLSRLMFEWVEQPGARLLRPTP